MIVYFRVLKKEMFMFKEGVLFNNSKTIRDLTNAFILSDYTELYLSDEKCNLLHKLNISLGKISIETDKIRKSQSFLSISSFVDCAIKTLLSLNQTTMHEVFKTMFSTNNDIFIIKSSIIKTIEETLYSALNKDENKNKKKKKLTKKRLKEIS